MGAWQILPIKNLSQNITSSGVQPSQESSYEVASRTMATLISSSSSSFILQPLKPSKPSVISDPKFLPLTIISTSQPKTATRNAQKSNSRPRKRSSYGTSRRSILKKTFSQEQVTFSAPPSGDPHVGIIGGGMAGLACALSLDQKGVKSTVFDTGIHGLGGRMGTRIIDPQPLIFDHAAQFFTVSDSRFGQLVDAWLERGLVQQWEGLIGELEIGGRFVPFPSSPPRYVGINGMRPLADSLLTQVTDLSPLGCAKLYYDYNSLKRHHTLWLSYMQCKTSMVNVVRPCWISKLEPFNGMWHLSENGKPRGQFDIIVIAHNGDFVLPCVLLPINLV